MPGINNRKPAENLTLDEFGEIVDVNLKGMFHLCKAVSEVMIPRRRGKIINMSSVFGLCVMNHQSGYASSKNGVLGLTKVLAVELAQSNIQVNAICPAHHMTPMVKQMFSDRAWREELIHRVPQRRFAEIWEIIGPAVFLASDATNFSQDYL